MKKLGQKQINRLDRINRKRIRRHAKRLLKRRKRLNSPRLPAPNRLGELKVVAPEVFSLSDNYEGVVGCILDIQKIALGRHKKGIRKIVDFSSIKKLEPAAALILSAEIDRWRRTTGFKPVPHDLANWDTEIFLQFHELGLFNLLYGMEVTAQESPIVQWIPFKHGKGDAGAPADQFLSDLTQLAGEIPERMIFYEALAEALLNVKNHAYISDVATDYACAPVKFGWWIAGAFDRQSNELTGLVFDQGLGIPATLPRSPYWETIRGQISNDDAKLIEAAIEVSRTRTSLPNRGKGLAQILSVIDEVGNGMLRVISGRGEIRYDSKGLTRVTHNKSLGGTLIEWKIPCPTIGNI